VGDGAKLSRDWVRCELDMETETLHNIETEAGTSLAVETIHPLWYAAYTSANHEKRVAEQLGARSVEHFVPLYESVRRWKDRKVRLRLPMFPGYVFVRLVRCDRLHVLQVPGVARLVGFNGHPCALPDSEIEALKAGLVSGVRAQPHPYMKVGQRLRVKAGPLAGLEGVLARKKNGTRFVISLDLIMRSVAVDVDALELETCKVESGKLHLPSESVACNKWTNMGSR
jgi:transcription antitermination factor NusG